MNNIFNSLELDLATEIINIGLAKAADSLSFFTQEKVLIRSKDLVISNSYDKELFTKSSAQVTILSTQIRGEMNGYCYLIFNQQEVEQLEQISFPASIVDKPDQLAEMSKAMLMEADNIITAAVVTQFSNLFKIDMHGYVPEFFRGNNKEVDSYIREHIIEGNYILHFNTALFSGERKISPEFLWCLDETFVKAVKKFVKEDVNMIKLQEEI